MNPRCSLHNLTGCFPCGYVTPSLTPREKALRDLNEAVRAARQTGLTVECVVTESVVTTL